MRAGRDERTTRRPAGWSDEMAYLRGLAILWVLTLHVLYSSIILGSLTPGQIAVIYVSLLFRGIPSFIFVSGFVLSLQAGRDFSSSPWDFYRKRLQSVLPPYLIFSSIYYRINHGPLTASTETFRGMLTAVLTGTGHWHMWFIANILQLYFLFPFLRSMVQRALKVNRLAALLSTAFLVNIAWIWICFRHSEWLTGPQAMPLSVVKAGGFSNTFFLATIFLFLFGMAASFNFDSFKKRMERIQTGLPIIAILVMAAAVTSLRVRIISVYGPYEQAPAHLVAADPVLRYLIGCFSVFLLFKMAVWMAKNQTAWASLAVGRLGQYSFGIFLIHPFWQIVGGNFLRANGIGPGNRYYYPLLFLWLLPVSYGSVWLISKLPGSRYLIGKTEGRGIHGSPLKPPI